MYYTKQSKSYFPAGGENLINFDGGNASWKVDSGTSQLVLELAVERYNSSDNYTMARIVGDKILVPLVPASVFGIVRLISETVPKAKDDNGLMKILLQKAHQN